MDTISQFTPIESLAGGAIMGIAVYHHLRFNGRVTGISGIVGGFLTGKLNDVEGLWRFLFLVGTLMGGAMLEGWEFLEASQPAKERIGFFDNEMLSFSIFMYIAAGLLVGVGTRIGSGCTSGHMLCGLSRASRRSFAATLVFGGVAALVTTLVSIATHEEVAHTGHWIAPLHLASGRVSSLLFSAVLATWAAFRIILIFQRTYVLSVPVARDAVSFLTGLTFALGLGVAGMTRQSKVHGFLNLKPLFMAGQWDPSLLMVMIGAMLPNMFFFHTRIKHVKPHLVESLNLPTKKDVDNHLLVGAALFGLGWGLVGICPGPGLVNLGAMASHTWLPQSASWGDYKRVGAFMGSMLFGMMRYKDFEGFLGL